MLGHVTTPSNTPPTPDTPADQPVPASDAGAAPAAGPPAAGVAPSAPPAPVGQPVLQPEPVAPGSAAAPGYEPAPGHAAAPGYPEGAYPAGAGYAVAPAAAPTAARNTLGLVALIIGVATLVLSTVTLVSQGAMLLQPDYDYQLINLVTTVFTSIGGLMAVAAVVLGAIGLAKKGAPKGAAGIGFGIGVATVWSILGNLIYSGILSVVF